MTASSALLLNKFWTWKWP